MLHPTLDNIKSYDRFIFIKFDIYFQKVAVFATSVASDFLSAMGPARAKVRSRPSLLSRKPRLKNVLCCKS